MDAPTRILTPARIAALALIALAVSGLACLLPSPPCKAVAEYVVAVTSFIVWMSISLDDPGPVPGPMKLGPRINNTLIDGERVGGRV